MGAPEKPSGYSAFISHASNDRATADAIAGQLEASGFRCWIAPRDVRPGQDYPQEIIRGIELSKCLVLVLSEAANNSSFVRAEVERAYSKGKPVFPIRVEEVLPSRALELFISTKHWIDAWHGDLSSHAARLVAEIARDPDLDIPLVGRHRKQARLRRLARMAGGAIGAAVIAGGVAFLLRSPAPDTMTYSTPPSVFFMGDLLRLDDRIEPSFLVNDGFGDSGYFNAFKGDMNLTFYRIGSDGSPELIYESTKGQFASFHQSSSSFTFEIESLPIRVVSCLTYENGQSGERRAALQGFNFNLPESEFATFPITEAAAPVDLPADDGFDCVASAASYAGAHMQPS